MEPRGEMGRSLRMTLGTHLLLLRDELARHGPRLDAAGVQCALLRQRRPEQLPGGGDEGCVELGDQVHAGQAVKGVGAECREGLVGLDVLGQPGDQLQQVSGAAVGEADV